PVAVRREHDVIGEGRVPAISRIRVGETIAVIPDRHLERVYVPAFGVTEPRLDEHLDPGAPEPVALANQVVPRHTLNAPRERGCQACFADGHCAADARE